MSAYFRCFIFLFNFHLFILFTFANDKVDCPTENIFNGKCLHYGDRTTWQPAETQCNALGQNGHLVSIGSEFENNFVCGKI